MIKRVFIRDDDVYKKDGVLLSLMEFCLQKDIPVVYAVIPATLTRSLAKKLNSAKREFPHLIDIVQHGWRHVNHNARSSCKYEFGSGRSYGQQKEDMRKGRDKMLHFFGKNFTPAFVPPYHGYDRTTLSLVRGMKLKIFSADRTLERGGNDFLNLPAELSLNRYSKDGRPLPLSLRVLAKRTFRQLRTGGSCLGLVFHHRSLKKKAHLEDFKKFLLMLKILAEEGHIRLTLFSDYLTE